jgi:hypothetical protein
VQEKILVRYGKVSWGQWPTLLKIVFMLNDRTRSITQLK